MAGHLMLPVARIDSFNTSQVDVETIGPALGYAFARRHGLLLLADSEERVAAVLREGADPDRMLRVQRQLGRPFVVRVASAAVFDGMLRDRYPVESARAGGDREAAPAFPALEGLAGGGNAGEAMLAGILSAAVRRQASDVHVEPAGERTLVRFRVAGLMSEVLYLERGPADALSAAVKQLAELAPDAAVPQEGVLSFAAGSALPDVDVATLPSCGGERMVLRLRPDAADGGMFTRLGMAPPVARRVEASLERPGGLVIVAGPPGSGRTTTLYTMLHRLNSGTRNLLAIERDVRDSIPGVGHIQLDPREGGTLAGGLRAILQQDPDVVLVRDIDDREIAAAAVQAAHGGPLVLAAIDARNAVEAITRLRALKAEPFQLAAALRMVIAQRLVRRLCAECRRPVQASGSVSALLGFDPGAIVYLAEGCDACGGTGFAGRVGVFEAIHIDPAMRRLIHDGGDEAIIARHAFVNAPNLGSAARAMVREGLTTPDEAVRISRG